MKCTNKEQRDCREEKMGCEGCYYNKDVTADEIEEAKKYFENKEISFTVDFDTDKLLKSMGITEEDSFEKQTYKIKVVLQALEEKDQEIEKLKNRYWSREKRYTKYKTNCENNHEKIYEDLVREIEEKDKMIDMIVDILNDIDYQETICKEIDCEHIEIKNEGKCIAKECIKEYFRKKASNE